MIKRDITKELLECAREYPVVTVFGPRQAGKTTLVQMTWPDKPYRSLEDPDIRLAAELDPRGFLEELPEGGILDEIQRVPQLLSYIQGIVDKTSTPGMFVLTGSHQPGLHQAISQSLAGRTAILTLMPFSLNELCSYKAEWQAFDLIVQGEFPRLHERSLKPSRFFNGYIQTYIERDIRALINIKDITRFQRFMVLFAGRVGQLANNAALSNDIGVSSTTVKDWISVLKATYVVIELQPFYANIRKRLVKTPKYFFCDTGLVCHLLGIQTSQQVLRDPLRGSLYENFIVMEILKSRLNRGKLPELYFYRDTHGNEVDLVVRDGGKLHPVEIKSASTFTPDFLTGIKRFQKVVGDEQCGSSAVIYNGEETFKVKGTRVFNLFRHGY